MSKEVELELTFLAKFLPKEVKAASSEEMLDIYIPNNSDFPVLRLRKKGNNYEITKKTPLKLGDYSSHVEHTIPLTLKEFEALKDCSSRTVSKIRYQAVINGYKSEVDVFQRELHGLVMIDFEFDSKKDMNNFKPPDCCLIDVTQEREILGGQLAGKKYDDLRLWLAEKRYESII
jgi:CYTH domain-containing protein